MIPIVYDGQHYPTRRALARVLAAVYGRPIASVETLISTCRGDAETIRRRLCVPPRALPPTAIPTAWNGQVFASRRALIRHLASELGQPFDLIHAKFYALRGDAAAVVHRFAANGNGVSSGGDGAVRGSELTPLADLMLDLGAALERLTSEQTKIATELAKTASERRQINERLDQLQRAQTEMRRALGQTELHIPLRHTRRRPLGAK